MRVLDVKIPNADFNAGRLRRQQSCCGVSNQYPSAACTESAGGPKTHDDGDDGDNDPDSSKPFSSCPFVHLTIMLHHDWSNENGQLLRLGDGTETGSLVLRLNVLPWRSVVASLDRYDGLEFNKTVSYEGCS